VSQRGLSGQKPKHAPFCMKGATTHTSINQKSPCVQNDRAKSTCRAPVP
jgi:hypothetical protein